MFGCGQLGHKIRHYPKIYRNEEEIRRRSQPYPSSGSFGFWAKLQKGIDFKLSNLEKVKNDLLMSLLVCFIL